MQIDNQPLTKLVRLTLAVALVALSCMSACQTNASAALRPSPSPGLPRLKPSGTPPEADASPIAERATVTGLVRDVSSSARILNLASPSGGYEVIALSDGCGLKDSAGKDIELIEISPGMKVSASGRPGSPGVLIAEELTAIGTGTE